MRVHVGSIEIHEYQCVINLNHTVLEPRWNRQLLSLHFADEVGKHRLVNGYAVKIHQGAEGGRNDGTGSCQTDLLRNVRGVGHLKFFFKIGCNRMLFAMVVESFDGGFKKSNATIIPMVTYVTAKLVDGFKCGLSIDKTDPSAVLTHEDFSPKVFESKRNGHCAHDNHHWDCQSAPPLDRHGF